MSGPGENSSLEFHSRAVNGKAVVRVSADGMEATLSVSPPRDGGQAVTLAQALQALSSAGVTFGIDSEVVEEAVREGAVEGAKRPLVVARGKAPVKGQDAVVTYHELLMTPTGYPQQNADGSVDHFQLNLVRNVAAGTVLAMRKPATKGVPGVNVLGATVPCQDGKEYPLRAGKGCRLSEDGLSVIADLEGHAVVGVDDKVTISPIFEIRGDVDASTGNIDFVGTVVIMGRINQGYHVKAGQNVEVHGGIDGGTVEAGGDVIVRYGIQGGNRGRVVAGGRVQSRFVENADIQCHGDLMVSDGILHSRVRCGGKVAVTGRRGSIIGGQIKAKEEVSSRILGTSLLTTTEIEVGVSPETRDELEAVRRSLTEVEEGHRKSQQAVSLLRELEAKNPQEFTPAKRSMLMKALRSLYHFHAQRDRLSARKVQLEEELQQANMGRVRAYDTAFPGVKITIGKTTYHVIDAVQHVCFYLSPQLEVSFGPA